MISISDIINKNRKVLLLLVILALIFVAIRVPGLDSPLHQDEYKWPIIVNPNVETDIPIPHPPFAQFVYETAGKIVGFDVDLRIVPLIFGTLNLLLLFYFMQMLFSRREAIIASLIWIFSFYSILASLMIDIDGAVMPFFFLLSLIGYYKLRYFSEDKKLFWWGVLVIGIIGGFLSKLSFLLVPAALLADFLWSKRNLVTKKDLLKYSGYGALSLVILAFLLFLLKFVFPFFDFTRPFTYLTRFFSGSRGWFQTGIQVVKALLYSSPLLVLASFFCSAKLFSRVKVFFFFLFFAFVFYILLFDSSLGALDRYLQLLILPLTVLTSIVLGTINWKENPKYKGFLIGGIVLGVAIFLLQFLPHYIPSLHPKSEWITRFFSFRWNFVYPFSGGSGPLGFYMSFLVLASAWLVSGTALLASWFKPHLKKSLIVFLIPISFIYSSVFIGEYLYGAINGSAPKLLSSAVEYIIENPDIEKVTVYNDNGGDEIMKTGKYRKRLYTDPKFDIKVKVATLNSFKEHYYVLDIPRIDPKSPYEAYLDSCNIIFHESDKKISSTIYDCRKAPNFILK